MHTHTHTQFVTCPPLCNQQKDIYIHTYIRTCNTKQESSDKKKDVVAYRHANLYDSTAVVFTIVTVVVLQTRVVAGRSHLLFCVVVEEGSGLTRRRDVLQCT